MRARMHVDETGENRPGVIIERVLEKKVTGGVLGVVRLERALVVLTERKLLFQSIIMGSLSGGRKRQRPAALQNASEESRLCLRCGAFVCIQIRNEHNFSGSEPSFSSQ